MDKSMMEQKKLIEIKIQSEHITFFLSLSFSLIQHFTYTTTTPEQQMKYTGQIHSHKQVDTSTCIISFLKAQNTYWTL